MMNCTSYDSINCGGNNSAHYILGINAHHTLGTNAHSNSANLGFNDMGMLKLSAYYTPRTTDINASARGTDNNCCVCACIDDYR